VNDRWHRPLRTLAVISLLLAAPPARAGHWDRGGCFFDPGDIAHAPHFADYPAPRRTAARPARPLLASAEARHYRTMIRVGAAGGPNFAGNFTIVRWGCGSGCVDWAIIDARTGRIAIDQDLRDLVNIHLFKIDGDDARLIFRPDSRLLILGGMPREDAAREGLLFLEWSGSALRRLRFVPIRELCR
jgi:hypothetical protein